MQQTFILPDDYQGRVIATLFERIAPSSDKAILYIHGYIDYFFQEHLAEHFNKAGYNFYALELRKYGRSLLPHQRAFYCRSLTEYFPEIDLALQTINGEGCKEISLMGHSTGGLTTSLYMSQGRERGRVNSLILNSPFFEFNTHWFNRNISIPLSAFISRLFPYAHKAGELSEHLAASMHLSMKGEWEYDLAMKPAADVPLDFAWLGAVRAGQRQLKKGLHINVPVLVMYSSKSIWSKQWGDDFLRGDSVLNVRDIAHYAPRLGADVTQVEIEDGMHDLTLSRKDVREKVFETMLNFLQSNH
ncbi:Lysophospholipase [Mucinivorans hirudinis]|uniref:Lysophospholipase n=1 Tax=Mucinivorans hirudinis TaxID=1433126 RepID=A0A060RD46_9BACT|nr:Lysophospholipase [Mucinivorans hirudinis]